MSDLIENPLAFFQGRVPLLISMPHAGLQLTPAVQAGLVPQAQGLPDTDWHIPLLYAFAAELGASTLAGNYSRYVVDLNRPADDRPLYATATTGLYPDTLFDGEPLFIEGGQPSAFERERYLQEIWTPYHQTLASELERLKAEFGYALLFDAHSIASRVPRLFDGKLPDFNLGTNDGASCAPELAQQLMQVCANAPDFSHVLNGRFKGGYITRHYGQPADNVQAVQLEICQCIYMDEQAPFTYRPALAAKAQLVLRDLLETLLAWRPTKS
ncbi:N-formylglutamate deformylase [Pseudomonas turukhanskensis]|uniref:N-formylglutamate deformylase n=1 Tax=Pseudomonas turukhanskensis TaxID=1806536 RepID=A0A9W6K8X6_9PSED|nr:N-formylglutamate deformylase [Pseudomonas turukhanskensis]